MASKTKVEVKATTAKNKATKSISKSTPVSSRSVRGSSQVSTSKKAAAKTPQKAKAAPVKSAASKAKTAKAAPASKPSSAATKPRAAASARKATGTAAARSSSVRSSAAKTAAPAKAAAPARAAAPAKPAVVAPAQAQKSPKAAVKAPVSVTRSVAASVAEKAAKKISAPVKPMPPKAVVAERPAVEPEAAAQPKKPVNQRHGFKVGEYVVYPAHGVGCIVGIEEQEIAGMSLELFVINFDKEKLTLRVPTGKLESVGMRKLSDEDTVKRAMDILKGRARVKRTMWSRRAQEYVAKINSGDLVSIAEVVRDLYRSDAQPEQSYSERQLYEDALDRMAREVAVVEKLDERGAVQRITEILSKSARTRRAATEEADTEPHAA